MFTMIGSHGLTAEVIPGNHDKTNYESFNSFLSMSGYHPAVNLHDYGGVITEGKYCIHMMPFLKFGSESHDRLFKTSKESVIKSVRKHLLFGHMSVEGSINNDGSKAGGMNRGELSHYEKVFLGHYHNTHEVNDRIVHIASLQQNNFGEDENKGMTIIYDDLSYEVYNLSEEVYKVFRFDLDKCSTTDILDVAAEIEENLDNKSYHARFEVCGNDEMVRGLDMSRFDQAGINIRKIYKSLEPDEIEQSDEGAPNLRVCDESMIFEEFEKYCKKKGCDHEEGVKILEEIIERSNGEDR
jgi:exonuclease SbcD